MKSDSSKTFSTILMSSFAIGLSYILFFSFVNSPKSGQLHGIYGLVVVDVIFSILSISGELFKKDSAEKEDSPRIYHISLLYFVIMALICLLYMLSWAESLPWFYTFHLFGFCILSVSLIAASTSTGITNEIQTKKVDLSEQFRDLRSRLSILCFQYSDVPWHSKLVRCQAEMSNFDTDITVPADVEIIRLVGVLEKALRRQKELYEAERAAIEDEENQAKKEEKIVQENSEISIEEAEEVEEVEEDEDIFALGVDDEEIMETEEVLEVSPPVVEVEEEEEFDIPYLVDELRRYVQQRKSEAKGVKKGKV